MSQAMATKRDARQAFGKAQGGSQSKKSKTTIDSQHSKHRKARAQDTPARDSSNHRQPSSPENARPVKTDSIQIDKFSMKKRSRSRRRSEDKNRDRLRESTTLLQDEDQDDEATDVSVKQELDLVEDTASNANIGAITEAKSDRSRSRRKQKSQFGHDKSHIEAVLADIENEPEDDPPRSILVERKREHNNKQERRLSKKHKQRVDSSWTISHPTSGIFIDHDLVLTTDESHLILATKHDIQIYATKTSLLIRTIHVTATSEITSYALLSQGQYIVVGLADNHLIKFDWTTGRKLWTTSHSGRITSILPTSATAASDGYLLISKTKDGSHNLSSLAVDDSGKHLGKRHMLAQKHILAHICGNPDLGVVVVCSKDTIFIGRLGNDNIEWQHVAVSGGRIACFDAQILSPSTRSNQPLINVAVSLQSGEIHIFNDVLNKPSRDLQARRLHWHRAAPRTVKFSPDSNYLISGGDETVLVIWQLDTNQKQTLPHLTTAILGATVSQKGSAYALRLADNSVMVLATSDLKPFAIISSLAFASSTAPYLPDLAVPAVLHPTNPERLLMAYSLQSLNPSLRATEKTANMLQTYDVSAQLQLNRQALARNLVATVNVGPGGQPLTEPEVTHLDISHDGAWLVTVDQWAPPPADINEMYLTRSEHDQRKKMNECFLRFWSHSGNATELWELNTRIDDPASTGSKDILAIATSPVRQQVAIADGNHHVKLYSPKARIRNGVPVTTEGRQLYTWTCDHDISLEEASHLTRPRSASLAFSGDGSILAVCWGSTTSDSRVHLIDTKTTTIAASLSDLITNGKPNLAFCGKYILTLSSTLSIYDTIAAEVVFSIDVDEKFNTGKSRMAFNTRSAVVAVAVSQRDVRQPTQLLLLDVATQKIVTEKQVDGQIRVLLPETDRGGFLVVDGEGCTMKIAPPGDVSSALVPREEKEVVSSIENMFGSGRKQIEAVTARDDFPEALLENALKVDSSAHAPGATDLFSSVARLVTATAA